MLKSYCVPVGMVWYGTKYSIQLAKCWLPEDGEEDVV